ncbi:Lysophospholipase L1 [Catalinimonas alkaloidigena]|uniref:Lysophospholipase L1 n=1 Tax=Catalinimonas alkaloidigena TaxID=1075417 RepID=A0A1G9KXN5_9BACT|nr:GDSL-type esterase/lipase family protein [Catalinimonas alkaloidigena]SDL54366.1 Lysophospholipase L1 [Catalinimonas alkaloidigena]
MKKHFTSGLALCLLATLWFAHCAPRPTQTASTQANAVAKTTGEPAPADPARFEGEVAAYEAIDQQTDATGGIMLVGSSSIRKWETMEQDLAPLPVIPRGFGGSTFYDLLHFYDRLVVPRRPDILVVYEGDNDIARGESPAYVLENARKFTALTKEKLPDAEIYFLAIKPSVARWQQWPQMEEANRLIETFTKSDPALHYIAVDEVMMQPSGKKVRDDIFIEDNLHMNPTGYVLWTDKIKPVLEKAYRDVAH